VHQTIYQSVYTRQGALGSHTRTHTHTHTRTHTHTHTHTHSHSHLYVQDMLFDMSSTIKQEEAAGSSGDVHTRTRTHIHTLALVLVCAGHAVRHEQRNKVGRGCR